MPRKRSVEDLSTEELRHLLIEKSQKDRDARIEAYRRSGRVIEVEAVQAEPVVQPPLPDDDIDLLESGPRRRARNRKKETLDRFLMAVEIIGVLGLVVIVAYMFSLFNNLNRQVSESLVQPTLTPTALITAIVLPSGHTPPVDGSEVTFNESEIPAHLRPLMQSLANLPVPTAGPQQAIRLQVPAINLDAPVVQGDGWEQLKKGVGQHAGTADPGQTGNLVLSAHNDVFGEIFRDLDQLKKGDSIVVYTAARAYTYIVTDTQVVEPTRVDLMAATPNATITLISCYPYRVDNQRIVVSAELQKN